MKNDDTLPDELHNQADDALLAACFARWPNLARYADTARIEPVYDAERDEWRECVTVTVWERGMG